MDTHSINALRAAKRILGSESAVAEVVGVKQPSVNYILNKADKVPAEWCIPLERATAAKGEIISRHQLRPDLYPVADEEPIRPERADESPSQERAAQ